MPTTGATAALNSAAKSDGASGMDGRRRVVDLDERGAGGDEPLQLRPQDRHERLGGGVAVAVDLARTGRQAARQRVRPGQRHLQRPRRAGPGVAELLDDAEAVRRGDRLEDLEAMLLVVAAGAQPAVGRAAAGRRSGA